MKTGPKKRLRLSEGERHAIGHAQYMVANASGERPEVCFDYELVATLLALIERLRATPKRRDE
jgi:hypothetical protein